MELKEGMYVRTEKGYIAKILGVDYLLDDNGCELNNIEAVYFDKMVDEIGKDIYAGCVSQVFKECRVRDNLIDLIEVGDYVNGELVIAKDSDNRLYVPEDLGQPYDREFSNGCFEYTLLDKNFEIKSIVTKEQFNSVKYEVE